MKTMVETWLKGQFGDDAETSSLAQAARALTDEAALRAAASRLRALCAAL